MSRALAFAALTVSCHAASAEDSVSGTVRVGLLGCVKVGRWASVQVDLAAENVKAVAVAASDPHGNAVQFPLRKQTNPTGTRFAGIFQVGRLNAVPQVVVEFADGRVERRRLRTTGRESAPAEIVGPLRQSVVLVATLGRPAGFQSLGKTESDGQRGSERAANRKDADRVRVLEYESAAAFPDDVRGLDALNVLVISGEYLLNAAQDAALKTWVREGGHLVVCRGRRLEPFANAPQGPLPAAGDGLLARWLPVTVLGQDWLRELNGLESYSGRKSPIYFGGQVRAARIADPQARPEADGVVLARSRSGPLIVRVACGFGQVTFCGVDFHEPPLSTWDEVNALGEKVLEQTVETIRSRERDGRAQLAQSGVSDMGTQLHSQNQQFPSVRRMSAFRTIGLLIVYILLIGPLDYVLVHRVLKRPRLTWVTFPLLVFAATYLSIRSADERNGDELRLNQFGLIDVDATQPDAPATNGGGQRIHGQTWFTAYSPESMRYALRARPASFTNRAADRQRRSEIPAAVCWSGITETVYGGMYRGGGLSLGQLTYSVRAEAGAIDRLPIPIWSTKTFKAEWRESVPKLIDSRLTLDAEGRLAGTIRHRFAAAVEDWILVHRGMLYRPAADADGRGSTFQPNVDLTISTTTVQQSGLMDHLTGVRFRKEGSDEDRLRTSRFEQIPYDPNGKDPLKFLQAMTFYRAIGGRKYTGLNDASVERLDLSQTLSLNRAVLVGRLRLPAANVALSPEADEKLRDVPSNRSDTFVRILLPVRR